LALRRLSPLEISNLNGSPGSPSRILEGKDVVRLQEKAAQFQVQGADEALVIIFSLSG